MEDKNESKIITYALVVLVIIIAIIAIIAIQMIDFSKDDTEEISNSNSVTNITKKNIKMAENKVENEVLTQETNTEKDKNMIFVTDDRITMYLEDGGKAYFQFDENNILQSAYVEVTCDSEQVAKYIEKNMKQAMEEAQIEREIKRDGRTITLEYPLTEEIIGLSKEELEQKLREGYTINYR